jgi:hypothetical protein
MWKIRHDVVFHYFLPKQKGRKEDGGAMGGVRNLSLFRKQSVAILHHFEFINKLIFESQHFLSQFFLLRAVRKYMNVALMDKKSFIQFCVKTLFLRRKTTYLPWWRLLWAGSA